MKPLSMEQRLKFNHDVAAILLLFGFCFWVNRGIAICGLAEDDLYLWAGFSETSFFRYVFPVGGRNFRCLYYLVSWLEFTLAGTRIEWMRSVNIILNSILAGFLYYLGGRLSGRKILGFFAGILFLASRMAFYQIGQVMGLLETMVCFLAIGLFYCLHVYLHEKQEKIWYFHGACILYFALCFVHERFMVLVLLFYLVLILKKRYQLRKWFWPLRQLLLVVLIRFLAMGSSSFDGIVQGIKGEGISPKEVLFHGAQQAAYLLGFNMGPKHLNALSWKDAPGLIHGLVYGADILLVLLAAAFLVRAVKEKEERMQRLAESLLFLVFIGLCIFSSSFSRQVEVPWVYVSYGGFLLLIMYLCGALLLPEEGQGESHAAAGGWSGNAPGGDSAEANFLSRHAHQQAQKKRCGKWVLCGGAVLYLVLMLPVEIFFRSHYNNLYFWEKQVKINSLARETYGKYKEGIFGKTIYLLGDDGAVDDRTAEIFFGTFAGKKKEAKIKLICIDSIRDIGLVNQQMLLLYLDKENGVFQDVTQFVKELKFNPAYGIYEDGWMDEECRFTILSGSTGKIRLRFLYPGELYGDEQTEIYVDGNLQQQISVRENIYVAEILAKPYQTLDVEIKSNFYVENALEQRGEKHLTALLEIETEEEAMETEEGTGEEESP